MSNVAQFPTDEERAQKTRDEFNADFKKRWTQRAEGAGEFSSDIWAWQEMLEQMGWAVKFYEYSLIEFTMTVDFDEKILRANIPKAYHMQKTMAPAIDSMFAGQTGRWFYEWKEVHDDAHRHVRDGDEWKDDKDYYMTVWYSMELYVRGIMAGEEFPVAAVNTGEAIDPVEPLAP